MRSSRLTALVILGGVLAGGLVLDATGEPASEPPPETVVAGVAMPAASPAGSLSSTWYCAGGTATDDGIADHVLLIANGKVVAQGDPKTIADDGSPWTRQFFGGEADGPVPFQYPAGDYAQELGFAGAVK